MLVAMAVSTVEWADGMPTLTGHFHPEPGPEEAQTPARKKLLQYTYDIYICVFTVCKVCGYRGTVIVL